MVKGQLDNYNTYRREFYHNRKGDILRREFDSVEFVIPNKVMLPVTLINNGLLPFGTIGTAASCFLVSPAFNIGTLPGILSLATPIILFVSTVALMFKAIDNGIQSVAGIGGQTFAIPYHPLMHVEKCVSVLRMLEHDELRDDAISLLTMMSHPKCDYSKVRQVFSDMERVLAHLEDDAAKSLALEHLSEKYSACVQAIKEVESL